MYPNQQNQNGNPYPPYPNVPVPPAPVPPGPLQAPNGQYTNLPPLNNSAGASGHNPYEFIMSPNSKKHSGGLSMGGSFGKQIALLAGIALVVITGMFVAFSAFKPKPTTPQLIAIVQRQQEIIRIATAATNQINSQDVSNFVTNTQLTTTTSQAQVTSYLQTHANHKMKSKELALDQDPKVDTLLSDARTAGNYDSTLMKTLTSEIETYEALLQDTYKVTASASTKQLVKQNFAAADGLLSQAKAVQTSN
jgi:hypothetical protein